MAEPAQIDGRGTEATPRRRRVSPNSGGTLREALDDYLELKEFVGAQAGDRAVRGQPGMVSRYYDVVTRFYEYGWGQSFHFSPRRSRESLRESVRRHELEIAQLLNLGPGMKVADLGCGVGGPMITIAKATGASITGLNMNALQIERGRKAVRKAGLDGTCGFLLANYMDVPVEGGCFDAAYTFDAFCHAPSKDLGFKEFHRLLRPGGELALSDWCLTESFDAGNAVHRDIRGRLEVANATPNLLTTSRQVEAAESAGFEILSTKDYSLECDPDTPWYRALEGRDLSLTSLGRIPAGRWLTARGTRLLELLRLAPAGTAEAARILNVAADSLVEAGVAGILTLYLIHARKPDGSRPSRTH